MSLPPLGTLPLERYVLMQWNTDLHENPSERRRKLARAFVTLGDLGRIVSCPNVHRFLFA